MKKGYSIPRELSEMNEAKCTRCGLCCYFYIDGVKKKCKHLVQIGKVSSCRIYNTPDRVGKIIYKDDNHTIRCLERINVNTLYKDCPFNDLIIKKFNIGDVNERV